MISFQTFFRISQNSYYSENNPGYLSMISFLQNILSFMNHEKECKSFGSYVIMDMDSLTNGSEIASVRA